MKKTSIVFIALVVLVAGCNRADHGRNDLLKKRTASNPGSPENINPAECLKKYHSQLNELRSKFSVRVLPGVSFFQFGMGNRKKLIYKDGKLYDPFSGKIYHQWPLKQEILIPNEYRVDVLTTDGRSIVLFEDETGVYVREGNKTRMVENTATSLNLPNFKGYKYSEILKVLHHEILINILESKPLPNFLVYSNPWRRDAAMMAMCLNSTGNLPLIRNWVMHIDDPYDRNNGGETEADNLGQTLYLVSLFGDTNHPVVRKILREISRFEVKMSKGVYIVGRTDAHEAPVYQTKWLKYGLISLGMKDPYIVPQIQDNYSSLFWWAFKDSYMPGTIDAYEEWGMAKDKNPKYPYIGWAADHFHSKTRNALSNRDYPLSWEQDASEADYSRMKVIDEKYVNDKISAPHTWHASEMFLYLLEFRN
jgi:hypothetical protein